MLQENIVREVPTWIKTYTGKKFYPLRPDPAQIDIVDIAHALSNQCRFTGHCKWFWSVGAHSVMVSEVVSMLGGNYVEQLWGLLHDASEAYAVDLPTPIKRQVVGYAEAEKLIMNAIAEAFDLPENMPQIVKDADEIMLATEARDLMGNPQDWGIVKKPLEQEIPSWSYGYTYEKFLEKFERLNKRIVDFK